MRVWIVSVLVTCLAACSSGDGKLDAGNDAGDDGGAGDDRDPGDVDTGDTVAQPDYDPEQSFLLNIPAGTRLCFGFCQERTWRQALDMIGLIDLTSGYYVLPRQEGFHQAEMIDQVIFGPEHWVLLPTAAAGEVQAEYQASWEGEWLYTFKKDFTYQGEIYHLEVHFYIRNDGSGWPGELVVKSGDYFFETTAMLAIRDGDPAIDEAQAFGLCDLPEGTLYTATTASGDRVVMDVRGGPYMNSCLAAGETSCLFLTGAQVQLGAFQQEVSDRLRLVYVGSHHNWYDEYLILLDPPAGDSHAVLVDAPDIMGNTPYLIQMDAEFNEVSRREINDWQTN
jgi:hypothetical protein